MPKVCVRKRTKKRKVLVQLAIVGIITWGVLLLVNYVVDIQTTVVAKDLSLAPAKAHLQTSSDTLRLHKDRPLRESVELSIESFNAQELTEQLQLIRMHNILRTSKSMSTSVNTNKNIATFRSQTLASQQRFLTNSQANVQKKLVEAWEKDFLSMAN